MKCCKSSNPLRRDGTSQKQRFPLHLREDYVQIDEREYAELINFTRQLSNEFWYYDGAHQTVGGWLEFFEQDLSFLLAETLLTDLREYKSYFTEKFAEADAELDTVVNYPALVPLLESLFQSFIATITLAGPPTKDLLAPPALMSRWIELLPDSTLFDDSQQYSFKDLVSDGRKRLTVMLKKLQTAHAEAADRYPGYVADFTGWNELINSDWELLSMPMTLPSNSEDYTYINSVDPADDLDGLMELLKACHDSLMAMVESLQQAANQYLLQSLSQFGWHNPQNGLFLAFLLLFRHAQDKLNQLGRKHLLYEYRDVLRFKERDLVGDQAVMIFQLRKGIPQHLLPAGTLHNGGKDKLGKPRYYASVLETIINQAKIVSLQTVFVERSELTVNTGTTLEPVLETFETVEGIFAAPMANSTDGLGAALDADNPQWNMFGEAQLAFADDQRTMPEAEIGFLVASPLFVMKEGQREIHVTFEVDRSNWDAYFAARTGTIQASYSVAAIEAELLHGLQVEYTSAKGWKAATIAHLFIVTSATQAQEVKDHLDLEANAINYATTLLLSMQIALYEGMDACVAYSEDIHKSNLSTLWPVLKFVNQGRSDAYSGLGIVALNPNPAVASYNGLGLFGGQVYKAPASGSKSKISDFEQVQTFQEVLSTVYNNISWNAATVYGAGTNVWFEDTLYQALGSPVPINNSPKQYPSLWMAVDLTISAYEYLALLNPTKIRLKVAATGMTAFVLENDGGRLKNNKPFYPFGALPVVGSRLYVGAQEIFGKQLDMVSFEITWQDPPEDLASHYTQYESLLLAADRSMTFSAVNYVPGPGIYSPATAPAVSYNTAPDSAPAYAEVDAAMSESPGTEKKLSFSKETAEEKSTGTGTIGKYEPDKVAEDKGHGKGPGKNSTEFKFKNQHWTADFSLLYEGVWVPLTSTQRRCLFSKKGTTDQGAKLPSIITFSGAELSKFARDLDLTEPNRLESNTPRGFLRMELATPSIAFGHKFYRDLYVAEAMRAGRVDANPKVPSFPGEPYTPVIKELKISYTSKAVLDLSATAATKEAWENRVEQFFHLHPFGHTPEHPYLWESGAKGYLVPQFTDEGYLYIGIEGLIPPSTLSVLFQLAEGSADPELDREPLDWSILVENQWQSLPSRKILVDTTDGMIASGVIRFELDADINLGNTCHDGQKHWLRAKIHRGTPAYLKGIEVIAQAVVVQFVNDDNEVSHLEKALPNGTIKALKVTDPKVKSVTQPYGSFGGKLPEQDDAFLTRVSERLRHKQRSINIWDYERMVLEEFPSIYKVKCLNHTESQSAYLSGSDWEISPGHVTVVCIPDMRNVNGMNPFEPKASIRVLKQIDTFLRAHVSPWVNFRVTNPIYEEIKITCNVGFVTGKDPGFYTAELEKAIQQFLSPWAFDHAEEIVFGGHIHRSHIIQFIEQQEYVDFVINFRMDQLTKNGLLEGVVDAVATTGRSILVTSLVHDITGVDADCLHCLPEVQAMEAASSCCNDITYESAQQFMN